MLPFYDLAIMRVSPWSAHIYLKVVLWKLWSLARKINFADITVLLACDKIDPIFLSCYLGKAVEASLKMFSMTT